MSDPLKEITALAFAKADAKRADDAAKFMAEHCDARIEAVRRAIRIEYAAGNMRAAVRNRLFKVLNQNHRTKGGKHAN